MEQKWFVFYTKSRHEEKVKDRLEKQGFTVFLPMQFVMRQWSDRKKKVKVPLFNSYIFVSAVQSAILEIVKTPGISWAVQHNGKPAVLHTNEYDTINRFIETGVFIETQEQTLNEGDSVVVGEGPLKGIRGKLLRTAAGDKFSVTLAILGSSMVITLDSRLLKASSC